MDHTTNVSYAHLYRASFLHTRALRRIRKFITIEEHCSCFSFYALYAWFTVHLLWFMFFFVYLYHFIYTSAIDTCLL